MVGVGLGVCAMIVVLSVMDGFESELKKRMIASELHILVQPTAQTPSFDGGFVSPEGDLGRDLEAWRTANRGSIQSFWPVVATEAILKSGKKVTGVMIKGVPRARLDALAQQMVESADAQLLMEKIGIDAVKLPGIYMGQELAYEMGLIPGDQVTLISPVEMEGPFSTVPRFKKVVIEGIYHSGLQDQELHTVFAVEDAVRSFLRRPKVVSQWEVSVRDFEQAPLLATQLRAKIPTLRVQDWMQLNSHLFASLRLERLSMFVILAFIVIVASFNIVTTLTLMVLEKRREISILKAMGARNGQVAAIFLGEGMLIGTVGILGGAAFGFLLCVVLRRYELIQLPDIYYDKTLPVTFNPNYYVMVCGCALVIVMTACLYPSKRAAQLDPLEGIRFG